MPECPLCASARVCIFTRKNGCTLYACHDCRYRFVHPVPDTGEVYTSDYFNGASDGFGYVDYDRDKEPMVPTFQAYLDLIRSYAPTARRLLDVGAATGFFVELANRHGFEAEGVDLAHSAVEQGCRKGRKVRQGTIHDLGSSSYDVITMLDVIEHVPDPEADLRAAREHMNDGGLLLINTPDTGSAYARLMGLHWHLLTPPEHIAYFDRRNLKRVLDRNCYRLVYSGTIGKQFTLPYIFSTLHAWQGMKLWSWLARKSCDGMLSRVKIPINLRDNMLVIARAV